MYAPFNGHKLDVPPQFLGPERCDRCGLSEKKTIRSHGQTVREGRWGGHGRPWGRHVLAGGVVQGRPVGASGDVGRCGWNMDIGKQNLLKGGFPPCFHLFFAYFHHQTVCKRSCSTLWRRTSEANRKQRWFCNGHACSELSGKVTVLIVGLSLHVFQCLPGCHRTSERVGFDSYLSNWFDHDAWGKLSFLRSRRPSIGHITCPRWWIPTSSRSRRCALQETLQRISTPFIPQNLGSTVWSQGFPIPWPLYFGTRICWPGHSWDSKARYACEDEYPSILWQHGLLQELVRKRSGRKN